MTRLIHDCAEQARLWVEGESVHSDHRGIGPECCPDFSCCNPDLLQPAEVRRAFAAADPKTQGRLCMTFLGGMIAKARPEIRVHITDGEPRLES